MSFPTRLSDFFQLKVPSALQKFKDISKTFTSVVSLLMLIPSECAKLNLLTPKYKGQLKLTDHVFYKTY